MHLKIKYPGRCFQNLQLLQEALPTNKLSAALPQGFADTQWQARACNHHLPVFERWRVRAATGDFLVTGLVQKLSWQWHFPMAFNCEPKSPARSPVLICGCKCPSSLEADSPNSAGPDGLIPPPAQQVPDVQPHTGGSAGPHRAQHRHPDRTPHHQHSRQPFDPHKHDFKCWFCWEFDLTL